MQFTGEERALSFMTLNMSHFQWMVLQTARASIASLSLSNPL